MKKIITTFLIIFSFSCLLFSFQHAAVCSAATNAGTLFNKGLEATGEGAGYETTGNSTDINQRVAQVIQILLSFVGVLLLVLLIYGGVKWLKSSGRDDEIQKSKKIIENAIIGIIVVVAAYAITAYVGSLLAPISTGGGGAETERTYGNPDDFDYAG